MDKVVVPLLVMWSNIRDRTARVIHQRGEAGLSTLEMAVIAVGLFLAAGFLVFAITNAVRNQINQIPGTGTI